jgi:hypothetical protein
MDGRDFSAGTRYEYDIYPSTSRGLVPQNTNGAGEFEDNTQLQDGDEVRVFWRSDSGAESAMLLEYTIK